MPAPVDTDPTYDEPAPVEQFGRVTTDEHGRPLNAPSERTRAVPVLDRPKDGKLTRAHMEEAIRRGGSVIYEGEVIKRIADLPDDADLVAGDTQRQAEVSAELRRRIADLEAQLGRVESVPATKPESEKAGQVARPDGSSPGAVPAPAPAPAPAPKSSR